MGGKEQFSMEQKGIDTGPAGWEAAGFILCSMFKGEIHFQL